MRVVILAVLGAVLAGCGGGSGACVVKTQLSSYCHDDSDPADCSPLGGTLSPGKSCASLGYTKSCPADGPNSKRLPGHSC